MYSTRTHLASLMYTSSNCKNERRPSVLITVYSTAQCLTVQCNAMSLQHPYTTTTYQDHYLYNAVPISVQNNAGWLNDKYPPLFLVMWRLFRQMFSSDAQR